MAEDLLKHRELPAGFEVAACVGVPRLVNVESFDLGQIGDLRVETSVRVLGPWASSLREKERPLPPDDFDAQLWWYWYGPGLSVLRLADEQRSVGQEVGPLKPTQLPPSTTGSKGEPQIESERVRKRDEFCDLGVRQSVGRPFLRLRHEVPTRPWALDYQLDVFRPVQQFA